MPDSLFNFERDIAPERNNYGFSGTGTESAFANAKADQQILPQLDLMVKLNGHLQREKAADLAYETSVFEFKQRKKSFRDERDADLRADELLGQIQSTVEDENLSPFERQEKISLLQLQNSETFANSRVAQQSLLAANKFLGSQMQQRNEKLSRKMRRKAEKRVADDTTGFDVNTVYRYDHKDQVESLRESYLNKNSAGGEKITAREAANLRNAGFAVTKNVELKKDKDYKEQQAVDDEVFNNKNRIDEYTIDQVDETIREVAAARKLKEATDGTDQEFFGEFTGLGMPDGTVLKGTNASALQTELKTLRSRIRSGLVERGRKRNKFLEKSPIGRRKPTTTPPPNKEEETKSVTVDAFD